MHESLFFSEDNVLATEHPRILEVCGSFRDETGVLISELFDEIEQTKGFDAPVCWADRLSRFTKQVDS